MRVNAFLRVVLVVTCAIVVSESSDVVGPGAMTTFSGWGGGGRRGPTQYMRVNDPAVGFFVGGSSDDALNGLYARTETLPASLIQVSKRKKFSLLYLHADSGYALAFAESPREPDAMEWVFMDVHGNDRIALYDNTLIPPAGDRWTHVQTARAASGDKMPWFKWGRGTKEDDADSNDPSDKQKAKETRVEASSRSQLKSEFDELPWQLIAVLSEDMLSQLARQQRRHDNLVRRALDCHPPTPKRGTFAVVETTPPETSIADASELGKEAAVLFENEEYEAAAKAYADATAAAFVDYDFVNADENSETDSNAQNARKAWTKSVLSYRQASALRRVGHLDQATNALNGILAMAPNFADALFEAALVFLDAGKATDSIASLEKLSCADRAFPDLQRWMTYARVREIRGEQRTAERVREWAQKIRMAEAEACVSGGATRFCAAWRQTGGCDPNGEREPEKDLSCRELTRSRQSGFCECSQALCDVAEEAVAVMTTSFARETLDAVGWNGLFDEASFEHTGTPFAADSAVLGQVNGNTTFGARLGCAHGDGLSCAEYCETAWRVATRRVDGLANAMEARLKRGTREASDTDAADAATKAARDAALQMRAFGFDPVSSEVTPRGQETPASSALASPGAEDVADRSDHYLALELPADFTETELKLRYRRASLMAHPDKPGGTMRAFQRVAEAYQTLADESARTAYDLGLGLGEPRENEGDTTLWHEVERDFFPEVHGWRPFWDPHERKRERQAEFERSRDARERETHGREDGARDGEL